MKMNENSEIEDLPKNLDVLIKEKLKSILNEFDDLCDTLEKLGITFRNDLKSSDSNIFLKGGETTDNKNKVLDLVPDMLQVSAMTCSSIMHTKTYSINTIDSEVIKSFSKETDDTNSIKNCHDNDSDGSEGDIDSNDISDCGSEASSTAVNLSKSNSDEHSFPEDISEIDSEVLTTKKYQIRVCSVENYSDGASANCFLDTSTNTVKSEYQDTCVSATSVPADVDQGDLLRELLSSDNEQKSMNVFKSFLNQATCEELKSPNSDLKPCPSDLRFSDSDQVKSPNEIFKSITRFLTSYLEATVVKKKSSLGEHLFVNDKVVSVNADETRENKMSDTESDLELNDVICAGMPQITEGEDFCKDSNRGQCENLKSSDSGSESRYSALYFSDSEGETSSSGLTYSDHKQENVLHTMQLRNAMNNIDINPDFNREETVIVEDSFRNGSGIGNHRENSFNSDETKVKKQLTDTFIGDEDWNRLPLCVKYQKNPKITLYEFLYNTNTIGFSGSGSDLCHSDWKLSEIDLESHFYKKSCKVFKMLSAIRDMINKHNSPPSDLHPDLCCTEGYQDAGILPEESSQNNPSLDNGQRSSINFQESTDSQPDRLDNIFKVIVKCHPIENFEIPPNATANPEIKLDIKDSLAKYTEDEMPLNSIDEKRNISEECNYDVDSHSFIQLEYSDNFIQNNSLVCEAFIADYLNTAVNLNVFLIKKAKDVSIEGYDIHRSILQCFDDDLGYLIAKLTVAINTWTKQFYEIHYNLIESEEWRNSSRGFYYMGMVRVCVALTEILLKYCLEKQLELEEYERDLMFYHEYSN